MKHAEKNEVDLLLRSLGKRERLASTGGAQAHSGAEHLDADELNSYAEDVLPPAARARYTSHIADCASCRRIVTQLTLAAGAGVRRETLSSSSRATFWQKLAPFFSPAVLRFAAPALVLFAVITVGIVAFRQQRESEHMAQNEPATSAPSLQGETNRLETKEGYLYDSAPQNEKLPQRAPTDVGKRKGQADGDVSEAAAPKVPDSSVSAAKTNESPATTGAVAQPAYAPEPAPPAKPPAELARSQVAKEKEDQAEGSGQRAETKAEAIKRDDGPAQSKDEAARHRSASRKAQELGALNSVGQSRRSNEEADARDKKEVRSEQETRSVGGRRFRKDGNTWIDTAYNSSLSVVNVKRGSEQYRALVADEPGLRTIGEELGGVVLVVWKGRVYRIQ